MYYRIAEGSRRIHLCPDNSPYLLLCATSHYVFVYSRTTDLLFIAGIWGSEAGTLWYILDYESGYITSILFVNRHYTDPLVCLPKPIIT